MKLINKLVFVFCLTFSPVMALCQSITQKAPVFTKAITLNDYGKKVTLSKGDFLTLRLKNHFDGGFVFNKPQFDSLFLSFSKHLSKSPAQNGRMGYPGSDTWYFQCIKRGKTKLKITSSRPSTKKDSISTFFCEVIIK